MDLSIIIVNYNVYKDVLKCIESIKNTVSNLFYEIIVVDNNSFDRSIENIANEYPEVKLILNSENKGFGYANNIAMNIAIGKYFILVNPDIIFTDNSIEMLTDFLNNNITAAVVGPIQIKPNQGIEYYYTFFPSIYSRLMQEFRLYMTAPLMKYRFFKFLDSNIEKGDPFQVDWVMGSCLMLKSNIFSEYGGFDEALFLYEEETEWQYRIKQSGWRIFMIPKAKVLHNHHSSASKLGILFVNYHEFRSRIIFDTKRFKGLKYIVRKMSILSALFLRLLYFYPQSLIKSTARKKLLMNLDLFKFSMKKKVNILNDRYDFERKLYLIK